MTPTYEFLMTRATECAAQAKLASLDNVRARALRSEAAWRQMAERTRRMELEREKARLERASRQITGQLD
ncbi:hypothetical protein EB810_13905 [Altererythrobacter sp. FM1]|nr:hypothetical protein EB810_13905 [Altererythrobacter sp. FM1]